MESPLVCPSCHTATTDSEFFCTNCGKKLKDVPLSTSLKKQIWYYALSILLPPIGLWWAIKYIRQGGEESKKIGIAIIILTLLSLVANIWIGLGMWSTYSQLLNSFANPGF